MFANVGTVSPNKLTDIATYKPLCLVVISDIDVEVNSMDFCALLFASHYYWRFTVYSTGKVDLQCDRENKEPHEILHYKCDRIKKPCR